MKDFDYYSTVTAPYPDRDAYRKQLLREIDDTPMTAEERGNAIADIPRRVKEWFVKASEPYTEERVRLDAAFRADCRKDLGYEAFLDEAGVEALEAYAWRAGHSNGYADVYYILCDLVDLAATICDSAKRQATA